MARATVFIIKEQMVRDSIGSNPMDYSAAMPYGDLEFITHSDMPVYPSSSVRVRWDGDVERFIKKYDPELDYIITTGQPVAIFSIGYLLGLSGKKPRFLLWRREENRYRVFDAFSTAPAI